MSAVRFSSDDLSRNITRTMTVTSGKGGVGKSSIVSNLAYQLGQQGHRVLIFDGDLSMSNVDIMFGVRPEFTLQHVVEGRAAVEDIILPVAQNVSLLPGGSGIIELQNLTEFQKRNLIHQVQSIPGKYDFLIIDTAPGIGDMVLHLNAAAHEINVIVTPDPASITDSYALIKVLNKYHKVNRFNIICNQVKDEAEGLQLFKRVSDVASRFLFVILDYRGSIPTDGMMRKATKSQQLLLETQPSSPAAESLRKIAKNLEVSTSLEGFAGGVQFYWEQLLGVAS
jgi:flagellar biosynthesis protein FlhG